MTWGDIDFARAYDGGEGTPADYRADPEKRPTRVFTIGYALDPQKPEEAAALKALKKIAEVSEGHFYEGTPDPIDEVFREIRKFF